MPETREPYGDNQVNDNYRPIINVFDRPEISKDDFRRLRSIAINLAAFAERHNPSESLMQQIQELREIVNGQAHSAHPSP